MGKIKNIFKKKDPERCIILVTDNRYEGNSRNVIELIELYFRKYGFEYNVVDDSHKDFLERFFKYEIEIAYKDKNYVERLLRVFNMDGLTIDQYERFLKMERIRRKTLNI